MVERTSRCTVRLRRRSHLRRGRESRQVLHDGCGQRTLVLVGGGNLKSLVVLLVLAVTAYMTLRGLLAVPRLNLIESTNVDLTAYGLADQSVPSLLAALSGIANSRALHWFWAGI